MVVYIWERITLGGAYVGVVEFEEINCGTIGTNVINLDSGINIERVNIEKAIFLTHRMYKNHYVFNPNSDVVGYDDLNCRLTVLAYGGKRFIYLKYNSLENGADPLHTLCVRVVSAHL